MTTFILIALGILVFQSLLAPSIRYASSGMGLLDVLKVSLGPRDSQPTLNQYGERADRAFRNFMEAFPVFITVALLLEVQGSVSEFAVLGAIVFLVARVLYIPSYLSGIFGLRSIVWAGGWVGLAMMLTQF